MTRIILIVTAFLTFSACTNKNENQVSSKPKQSVQKTATRGIASTRDYWTDIEGLCLEYSGATHPPCNRSNGAEPILSHVIHNCRTNTDCLNKAVEICIQYSPATRPPCNASNGIEMVVGEIQRSAQFHPDKPKRDYWSDLEAFCLEYSGATHPPCNRSNGAKMMIDHIKNNCGRNAGCMNKAVELCTQYSPATRPPCNSSNGLEMVLGEVERVATFYAVTPGQPGERVIEETPEGRDITPVAE